jgi:hypothetical protein
VRPAGRSRNPTISSGPSSRWRRVALCPGAWSSRRAAKDVERAHERDRAIVRSPCGGQDVQRRPVGDDLPPLQQEQPRAQGDSLCDAVRHVEHRDRQPALEIAGISVDNESGRLDTVRTFSGRYPGLGSRTATMLERWNHVGTIVLRHRLPDASRFVQRVASAFVQHGQATTTGPHLRRQDDLGERKL